MPTRAETRRVTACMAAAMVAGVLCSTVSGTALAAEAADVYGAFNRFCIRHYGAEKDPLVYGKFGKDLKILEGGTWAHMSRNSACIAWETNLPAKTYVEYGETRAYGKRTREHERHFYIHVHYLKDLEAGKAYHYRLVSVDERGNRIASENRTFETKKLEDAIDVPGNLAGPPYKLDRAGKTYVLTQDILADAGAIEIAASEVTLDLNGHTLTYNQKRDERKAGDYWKTLNGIKCSTRNRKSIRILNGTVKQGAGNNPATGSSLGVSPIYAHGGEGEIAGITCIYGGPQVSGMYLHWAGPWTVHHNVVQDLGKEVLNRHHGCGAIGHIGGKSFHHNLVKRSRHVGIRSYPGSTVAHNEVYVESCATNAMCVITRKNVVIERNRLFGTGRHVYGIGCFCHRMKGERIKQGVKLEEVVDMNVTARENLIHIAMSKPGSGAAFRFTWGSRKARVLDNLFLGYARNGGRVSGSWIATNIPLIDVEFRNNIFKMTAGEEGETSGGQGRLSGCLGIGGVGSDIGGPVVFRDNTFITDLHHITQSIPKGTYFAKTMGEWYTDGWEHTALFINNKFIRVGKRADYCFYNYAPPANYACNGFEFFDSQFQGGAGYDRAYYLPKSQIKYATWPRKGPVIREFSVGWTVSIETAPNAKVTIKDKTGEAVTTGKADAQGKLEARLLQYAVKCVGDEWTEKEVKTFTPHTVIVEKGGGRTAKQVTVDRKQTVQAGL